MRLWPQQILHLIDRQRLLGQHRECCSLRGGGWGKKHAIVDYVFEHDPAYLVAYHKKVMEEMKRRGYHVDPLWENIEYRGKTVLATEHFCDHNKFEELILKDEIIFPEHNDTYLNECLELLKVKGAPITYER